MCKKIKELSGQYFAGVEAVRKRILWTIRDLVIEALVLSSAEENCQTVTGDLRGSLNVRESGMGFLSHWD